VIIDKIKEDWFLSIKVLLGILLIVLSIIYFRTILYILFSIGYIALFPLFAIFIFFTLEQSYKTGLMGFLFLIACMIYNPNMEKFDLFIKNEVSKKNIIYNRNVNTVKILNKSDWVIFSIYTVKCSNRNLLSSDNNQSEVKEKFFPSQYYIGILKNFWNITTTTQYEIDSRVLHGDTWIDSVIESVIIFVDSILDR